MNTDYISEVFPTKMRFVILLREGCLNFIKNVPFLTSAVSYFLLYLFMPKGRFAWPNGQWFICAVAALIALIWVSAQIKPLHLIQSGGPLAMKIIAFISSIGTALFPYLRFLEALAKRTGDGSLLSEKYVGGILCLLSVYFIFVCTLFVFAKLKTGAERTKLFDDVTKPEIVMYGIIVIMLSLVIAIAFKKTLAFWGASHQYNIIYTSDTPSLLKGNVFLNLEHPENDIRQPLFAVYSAPFMGIPFLFSKFFCQSGYGTALFVGVTQIIMLVFSFFLLSRVLNLSSWKRMCFMLFCFSSYTFLLASIMIEQYVGAFFWLMWAIYIYSRLGQIDCLSFCGASGSLAASVVLFPMLSRERCRLNFKKYILDLLAGGGAFLFSFVAFFKSWILVDSVQQIRQLERFAGGGIPFADRRMMYFAFVKNCFAAPAASVNTALHKYPTWQLVTPLSQNKMGMLILLLSVLSFIVNRKKKCTAVFLLWVCFSIVMLLFVGWGTQENGLILYSLYFGWAFLALIFQLVNAIEEKVKMPVLLPTTMLLSLLFLALNMKSFYDMLKFAVVYYPN